MKLFKRLFVPDCHAPHHDERAVKVMLEICRVFRPDEVVVLGDFFDCVNVSSYPKDPRRTYKLLEEELAEGRKLLQRIENASKGANYVFLQGNHENRIDRYVSANAEALGGSINTRDVLKLPKYWKYVPYGGTTGFHRCGPKLIATHGSLYGRHVCASMVQKYGTSVIHGHVHRIQEFHIKNVQGDDFVAFTPGWLGDMESAGEYITDVADWSHGFAVAWFKPNGDFFHQIIPIKRGEAVFQGKLYR